MAISVNQNGHFEEMGAWLQILQIVGNSTLFYLLFDTHDSPGSVFILKYVQESNLIVCIYFEDFV